MEPMEPMEMDMRQRIDRRRREQFAKFTRALGEAEALSNLKPLASANLLYLIVMS